MSKNVSNNFKNIIKSGGDFYAYASVKLVDGTTFTLDSETDFFATGNSYSEDAGDGFPLGSALSKQISIHLDNHDDRFSNYDFYGAEIVLYTEADIPGGTTERILEGTFTVIDSVAPGDVLDITAYDDMYKLDSEFISNLVYPVTLQQLWNELCDYFDVSNGSPQFKNNDFIVQTKPDGATGREMAGYIAQIAVGNAVADANGRLCIKSYDFSRFDESETVTPGEIETDSGIHILSEFMSDPIIGTDDVVITGITTSVTNDEGETSTVIYGDDEYAISIDNPLITGKEQTAIALIGDELIGLSVRPFSGDFVPNPTIEVMDLVYVVDKKDKVYKSFVTSHGFTYLGFSNVSNGLESPERNRSSYSNNASKIYQHVAQQLNSQKTQWETAVGDLQDELENSSGLYPTEEKQPDGSTIYYFHDKPTLEESQVVFKITSQALAISTDGGNTYPTGITVDGEAIISILNTIGINADWINAGAIKVTDDKGSVLFLVDMDTKQILISGDSVQIGGKSATEAINEALEAAQNAGGINLQLDNDFQGISTDYEGNISGSFPECKTTAQVFYGQTDITNNCVFTTTKSASITGSWNNQTKTYTVTGLSADSGWVDITATYLTTISVTKRFGIEKIKGGVPGQDGTNGTDGVNGVGVLSTEVTYQASYSGTTVPTGKWLNSIPQVSAGQYLWTRTEFNFSDDSTIYTYSVSRMGENGTNGEDGSDGLGILSTEVRYQASSSGTTVPSGTWHTSVPSVPEGQYLWTRTVITYTDYTTTTSYSVSRMGKDGAQGIPGDPGEDGKTSYFHIKYSAVSNPTSSSQMSETPNAYIGTYVDFTQADSNDPSDYTWAKFRGDNGADGIPGTNGENGQTSYLHIAYANNSTGTLDFSTTNSTNKTYIGQYVDFIKSDSNSPSKYNWTKIKGDDGQDGQDGQPGRTFFIEPSATILKRTKDNAISPSQISFSAYYRDGDSATRYSYSGRWIIDTTSNGSSYTEIYRSSSNESSVSRSLTGISSSVIQIRARLYASGGFTTMIDSQSVAIVNDVDSLTPLKVLELISQGMEGIYSPDGVHYYINASAIKSGQIQGIEIISESGNDWMKMSQSLLTGGYGSTTDGLLDLSANYSSGRHVVLESKTGDVILKSSNEFRVQRQSGGMGYLVQSGGTDYFDDIGVSFGDTYPVIGIMYGEDDISGDPFLDIRLSNGRQVNFSGGSSPSTGSMFLVRQVSGTVSQSNGYGTRTISLSYSGYEALGIVGYSISSTYHAVYQMNFNQSAQTVTVGIRHVNDTSASGSVNVYCQVLYVKSR